MEDNKKYEEIFSEVIKEAVNNSKELPSFYEDMTIKEFSVSEKFDKMNNNGRRSFRKSILKVAIFTFAFIVSSAAMAVFISETGVVEAAKTKVMEIRWSLDGDVEKVQEEMGTGEYSESLVMSIFDYNDIQKAKAFLPELYLPTYIPKGYEFSNIEVSKSETFGYMAIAVYKNFDQENLIIYQNHINDDQNTKVSLSDVEAVVECSKGELYLGYNEDIDRTSATVIVASDSLSISINGNNYEEVVKIIDCLNK